ncbi:DNA-binding response OmpR family regulator [Massilia aurea]|uniref:DNA-binding response OmpR family regulator n=1 Tax=Massilia aurea TaxID=373040 RepID=A0A7W9U6Y1_9BURK|nr:response regulator [Massilia aurea]MBB6132658.1 DNA-binding response OmpR family regulator [Massilia aurea]
MENSAGQHRILVVDDNQDAAELLQMILEIEGYRVRVAFDGASGLRQAADFRPHVTCSDLNMPGLSGFELALAIRKSDHSSGTHLIAMTGLDTQENFSMMMASGFDVHFCKPFSLDEFTNHLRSFFTTIDTR